MSNKYRICHICNEPYCLGNDCLFEYIETEPGDTFPAVKNAVKIAMKDNAILKYVPLDFETPGIPVAKDPLKEHVILKYIPFDSGNSKGISWSAIYVHGVKLFWFLGILVAVISIIVFGGVPIAVSVTTKSQIPLQVYIGLFAVGVIGISLALANIFGTETVTVK